MALQRRTVTIPVVGSVDERGDDLQSTKLAELSNADLSELGAIKKRRELNITPTSPPGMVGRWPIPGRGKRLFLTTDFLLKEYLPTGDLSEEAYLGKQCQLTHKALRADSDRSYELFDSVIGSDGSLWVVVSIDVGSGHTWEIERYTATGETLVTNITPTSPGASTYAKVLAWESGGSSGVVAIWNDSGTLYAQRFRPDGTEVASKYVVAAISTSGWIDACQESFTVGYVSAVSGANVVTYSLDLTDDSSGSPALIDTWAFAADSLSCEVISPANNVLVVAFDNGTGIRVRNAQLGADAVVRAPVTSQVSRLVIGQHTDNHAVVSYRWDSGGTITYAYVEVVQDTLVGAPSHLDGHAVGSMEPASRPVRTTHGTYIALRRDPFAISFIEPRSYHLVRVGGPADGDDLHVWPVAHYAYDVAGRGFASNEVVTLPRLMQFDDDTLGVVSPRSTLQQGFASGLHILTGASLWRFDFRARTNYEQASIGGLTVFAGAAPAFYDGRSVQMLGHPAPPVIERKAAGTVGSLTSESTYTYIAVYEFRDATGKIWRSAPSIPASIDLGVGQDSADIDVYGALNRIHPGGNLQVRIALYRNTQATPTIYYRVTHPADTSGTTAYTLDWNDATATVSIRDTRSDASISTNEILYTVGGVLENHPPPPLVSVCEHRNRLFGIHAETGDIWGTKEYVTAEGLHFSAGHIITNPIEGDIPTALVSTESALLVIYRSAIGQIFGDGPNDLGQGAWSQIEFMPGNVVGAISQRAVAALPQGVFLVDPDSGPHLMSYGGMPQRIGQDLPVQEWDLDSVVGVDYLEDRDEVRVVAYDGTYRSWHPSLGIWTTGDVERSRNVDTTAVWGVDHTIGTDTGGLMTEASGLAVGGETIRAVVYETQWIKLAALPGIQGRFRLYDVYLIGEYLAAHNLIVKLSYDFDDTTAYEVTFEDASLSALTPYQVRIRPNRQQVQALKIRVSEYRDAGGGNTVEDEGTTPGYKLSQIRLDFGIHPRGGRPWIKQGGKV